MFKGIIGRKLGMTQVFDQKGNVIPVTVIEAGPCSIVQIKTQEKEGYNAVQLGFLPKKPSRVNKPLLGHFQKAGVGPFYILKEFKVENPEEYTLGQEIRVDVFKPGDYVDVTGLDERKGIYWGYETTQLFRCPCKPRHK